MEDAPIPSRHFTTSVIPLEESVSWKIYNISNLIKTNSWTAMAIPIEVGLGATELSRWTISLYRNKDSIVCARATLVVPEGRRRVTHHLKVAITSDRGPYYYFSNRTNNYNNDNDDDTGDCTLFKAFRNMLTMRSTTGSLTSSSNFHTKLDDDVDATSAKETSREEEPTIWKVAPVHKIITDATEHDSLTLIITLTVFGCDVSENR